MNLGQNNGQGNTYSSHCKKGGQEVHLVAWDIFEIMRRSEVHLVAWDIFEIMRRSEGSRIAWAAFGDHVCQLIQKQT